MIPIEYFWSCILLLALGTLIIRFSIIGISERIVISDRTKEIFSYIPAAILPALAVPVVFFHQGNAEWILGKERFAILILSTLVCYFSKSTLATVGFGLIALYAIANFA